MPMRLFAIALERFLEVPDDLALLRRQMHRRLDGDTAEQVAAWSTADGLHAFVAQPENASRLRLRRNLDRYIAVERRHDECAAERGRRKADRHLTREVLTVALEDRVVADMDLDVEIARRAARTPSLSFARETDAIARVDTGRHLDRKFL